MGVFHWRPWAKPEVHVPCGCGSVLLWCRCNTLCTFGFVDDVTFSHNGTYCSMPLVLQWTKWHTRWLILWHSNGIGEVQGPLSSTQIFLQHNFPVAVKIRSPSLCKSYSCVLGWNFNRSENFGLWIAPKCVWQPSSDRTCWQSYREREIYLHNKKPPGQCQKDNCPSQLVPIITRNILITCVV